MVKTLFSSLKNCYFSDDEDDSNMFSYLDKNQTSLQLPYMYWNKVNLKGLQTQTV